MAGSRAPVIFSSSAMFLPFLHQIQGGFFAATAAPRHVEENCLLRPRRYSHCLSCFGSGLLEAGGTGGSS